MRQLVYTNPRGQSITLGTNPYLIESLEGIESPGADVQSTRAPVQDGSTYIDALLGNREVVARGSINSPQDFSDIYIKRRAMQSVLNPKLGAGTLFVTVGGGETAGHIYPSETLYPSSTLYPNGPGYTSKICYSVVVSSLAFDNKYFQNPFQGFQVQFDCLDPYMYDQSTSSQALSSGTPVVIDCMSDYDTPVEIQLAGGTNPTITNQTTGESISFTYSGGGTIIVTTEFGNKTAKIGATNVIGLLNIGSVFWNLAPGNNSILLSGGGTATVSWTERYIGV